MNSMMLGWKNPLIGLSTALRQKDASIINNVSIDITSDFDTYVDIGSEGCNQLIVQYLHRMPFAFLSTIEYSKSGTVRPFVCIHVFMTEMNYQHWKEQHPALRSDAGVVTSEWVLTYQVRCINYPTVNLFDDDTIEEN